MNEFNLSHICKRTDAIYVVSPVPTSQSIAPEIEDAAEDEYSAIIQNLLFNMSNLAKEWKRIQICWSSVNPKVLFTSSAAAQ
mgnify:CR=1 FL=1